MKTLRPILVAALLLSFPPAARAATAVAAADPGLRYTSVTSTDGTVLSVAEAGPRDAPAVLFLHGIGQSLTSWRRQLESPLAQRLRLVAVDLRGHGDSGKPSAPQAYQRACQWADDVRAVREALGLERPVLVAWSFGGLVAMNYVRCEGAQSLAGLALIATAGGRLVASTPAGPTPAGSASRDMTAPDLRLNLQGARTFARLMTATPPDAAWEDETVAALLKLPAYVRRAMGSEQFGPTGERITTNEDLVARLTLPLMVVTGAKDALSDGTALAASYRARFPEARVLTYPESGHSPFAEAADRFNADLESFVVNATRTAPPAAD
jgi:pimeloyl-ACP methyl ester carboxylesterase